MSRYVKNLEQRRGTIGEILPKAGLRPEDGQDPLQLVPALRMRQVTHTDEAEPSPPARPSPWEEEFRRAFLASAVPLAVKGREKMERKALRSFSANVTGALAGTWTSERVVIARYDTRTKARATPSNPQTTPVDTSRTCVVSEASSELAPLSIRERGLLGRVRKLFGDSGPKFGDDELDGRFEVEGDPSLLSRLAGDSETLAKIRALPEDSSLDIGGRYVVAHAKGEIGLTLGGRPHQDAYTEKVAGILRGLIEAATAVRARLA